MYQRGRSRRRRETDRPGSHLVTNEQRSDNQPWNPTLLLGEGELQSIVHAY